jgi:hypothetical protein
MACLHPFLLVAIEWFENFVVRALLFHDISLLFFFFLLLLFLVLRVPVSKT